MTKHTPGPWEADFESPGVWDVIAPAGDHAMHPGDLMIVAEGMTHANARLIAAAPELLAALQGLMDFPSGQYSESAGYDAAWDRAEAAIKKATNPSNGPAGSAETP